MTTLTHDVPSALVPTSDDAFQHVRYTIANAPLRTWPYLHKHVESVFPASYYEDLGRHFPTFEEMQPLNERYPNRRRFAVSDDGARSALSGERRAFWDDFVARFATRGFVDFFVRSFDPVLADRSFGRLRPVIDLMFDAEGYGIGPHVDMRSKVITALFYLPERDEDVDAGTSILVKTGEGPPKPHHLNDWEGFESAFTAPYHTNSMLAFLVTRQSYHAVRPTAPGTIRRTLQMFIHQED
ncbi:MAG: 2OG-Fe(II) oxygenase [Phycisphaerales bacterium]|nr:2OG-Fe(II) oxygenase [Phycisphaerales bacterium]